MSNTRFYTDRSAEHIAALMRQPLMPFVRSQIRAEMAEHSEHITLQGIPESTEGTVLARNGRIGWYEFTGFRGADLSGLCQDPECTLPVWEG
jgi:hypothetical protein